MRSVFDQVRRQTLTSPPSDRAADFLKNYENVKVNFAIIFNFVKFVKFYNFLKFSTVVDGSRTANHSLWFKTFNCTSV